MAATKLRQLLARDEFLVCPGVYDGISARIALSKGFDCLYMTGAGTVSSRFGAPDIGVAGLTDMVTNASMIAGLDPQVPLIADADTGYGGSYMCARTLKLYARAGIAGLHVEDQVQAKRCGHLLGKELVPLEEYCARIKSMVIARDQIASDIVIIARTDALQEHGVDAAIARCKAALDLGADVAFVEGITTKQEAIHVVQALTPAPVLVNLVANGVTPNWTAAQAAALGFKMSIHPCASVVPASMAINQALDTLRKEGSDAPACGNVNPRESFMQMGLKEAIELDYNVGGSTFSTV
ncbi:methylisocitrate lyase [Gongronella butleri]|nr:methylisocitrate lyase [Gongronella butleri]